MSNIKKVMLIKDATLSSHLADYVLLIGKFLLDFASLKTLLACSNEVCNSHPANVISLNKILSYARLSRNTERQSVQFIVFKTRTKRVGEARNCLLVLLCI